jgi:hypothetical protein
MTRDWRVVDCSDVVFGDLAMADEKDEAGSYFGADSGETFDYGALSEVKKRNSKHSNWQWRRCETSLPKYSVLISEASSCTTRSSNVG